MPAHWHIAYRASPCDCGVDGDFLIDDDTYEPIAWRCELCGDSGAIHRPTDDDGGRP